MSRQAKKKPGNRFGVFLAGNELAWTYLEFTMLQVVLNISHALDLSRAERKLELILMSLRIAFDFFPKGLLPLRNRWSFLQFSLDIFANCSHSVQPHATVCQRAARVQYSCASADSNSVS